MGSRRDRSCRRSTTDGRRQRARLRGRGGATVHGTRSSNASVESPLDRADTSMSVHQSPVCARLTLAFPDKSERGCTQPPDDRSGRDASFHDAVVRALARAGRCGSGQPRWSVCLIRVRAVIRVISGQLPRAVGRAALAPGRTALLAVTAPSELRPCWTAESGALDTEPVAQMSSEATASGESPSVAGGGGFRRPARGAAGCGEAASRS